MGGGVRVEAGRVAHDLAHSRLQVIDGECVRVELGPKGGLRLRLQLRRWRRRWRRRCSIGLWYRPRRWALKESRCTQGNHTANRSHASHVSHAGREQTLTVHGCLLSTEGLQALWNMWSRCRLES